MWILVYGYYVDENNYEHIIKIKHFETKSEANIFLENIETKYSEHKHFKSDIVEISNPTSIKISHDKNYETLDIRDYFEKIDN